MQRVMTWKVVLLVLALSIAAVPLSVAATIPQIINYQGVLTQKTGGSVPDGSYNIEFNIYDVTTGGTSLWKEKWDGTTSPVIVVGGVFNVMLGAINPLPANFFAEHQYSYLGVKVGADSEMLPRQRIASVGYAFAAGNGIPKGGIIMWSGLVNLVPDGWALCDGTNGTPNLLDRFIVGAGASYAIGATGGEVTHVLSVAEMPGHTHVQDAHNHTQNPHRHNQAQKVVQSGSGETIADNDTANEWTTASATATNNATTATNQYTGGGQAHENRPPYYALAFIMKL